MLFRCPADRRQIGIMAERIFDKQKSLFMSIYNDVTMKPYSYVLVNNKADTSVRRQIVSDVFGSCMSYTLPGILGSMTIEPQSAESMNTNNGDVQSFPMNAKQSAVKCSTATILQINDRPGPLLVHLNHIQWSMVNEAFRESRCGGNLQPGWEIWRIYVIKANSYYKPVLLKERFSSKTMFTVYKKTGYYVHVLCISSKYSGNEQNHNNTQIRGKK